VDVFGYIVAGGLGALLIALLLIGRFYPGSGADVLDWRPTRSPEAEAELELEDIDQMLEAQNERRRRRGDPELTEEELHERIAADRREQRARREAYLDDEDADQMRAALEDRRAARESGPASRETDA
jgi:hypothetical protein